MSLQALAGNLQSAGRGDDSLLVHMTPGEVHGLQSLAMAHGGSLTINPQTGLPEAGFLSSILQAALPIAAGFALGPAGLGMSALGAAATVGGVSALATGSLQKGLMAGLGAYGGGGLGESLASTGAPVSVTDAIPTPVGATAATNAVPGAITNTAGGFNAMNLGQQIPGLNPAFAANTATASGTLSPMAQQAISATPTVPATSFAQDVAQRKAAQIFTPLVQPAAPVGLLQQAKNWALENPLKATGVGVVGAGLLSGLMEQPTLSGVPAGSPGMIRPSTFSWNPTGADQQNTQTVYDSSKGLPSSAEKTYFQPTYVAQTPYAAPGKEYTGGPDQFTGGANAGIAGLMGGTSQQYTPEQIAAIQAQQQQGGMFNFMNRQPTVTAADGGLMGGPVEQMANANAIGVNTGYPMANLPAGAYSQNEARVIPPMMAQSSGMAVDPFSGSQTFAGGGGVSDLGSYSDGGRLLRGPGTGLSDNIPAQIGARQPARLANNEFVLPADVVSAVGGGSTDAGAKEFYKMMDRVRMAAHGSKKQIRPVNLAKVMPA